NSQKASNVASIISFLRKEGNPLDGIESEGSPLPNEVALTQRYHCTQIFLHLFSPIGTVGSLSDLAQEAIFPPSRTEAASRLAQGLWSPSNQFHDRVNPPSLQTYVLRLPMAAAFILMLAFFAL